MLRTGYFPLVYPMKVLTFFNSFQDRGRQFSISTAIIDRNTVRDSLKQKSFKEVFDISDSADSADSAAR